MARLIESTATDDATATSFSCLAAQKCANVVKCVPVESNGATRIEEAPHRE